MITKQHFGRILGGSIAGGIISLTLAMEFFDLSTRALIDRWFLVLVPAAAFAVCLIFLMPALENNVAKVSNRARWLILLSALLASFFPALVTRFPFFPALFIFSILLIVPAASS
ncbi:MAG TPA: hypothetical protein PLE14_06630, partial [Anaerolineales bacterium]|nr:hypothetical protein [Anaerolineales bacterium]